MRMCSRAVYRFIWSIDYPGSKTLVSKMEQPIEDDRTFWGKQHLEHTIFLYVALASNKPLQERAGDLYRGWKDAPWNKQLVQDTEDFLKEVLQRLKVGEKLGFLPYSFYEHLLRELQYSVKRITTGLTYDQEVAFWKEERTGELAVGLKLLDPKEEAFEEEGKLIVKALQSARNSEEIFIGIQEMQTYLGILGKEIENATVLTSISVTLAKHVEREGKRALEILG